jgi:hypothetical protein
LELNHDEVGNLKKSKGCQHEGNDRKVANKEEVAYCKGKSGDQKGAKGGTQDYLVSKERFRKKC